VIITAFRITKASHAATIWSGIGARDFGGRWNSKGVAVVYTAENRSLAALEQLAHLIKPRVLKSYVLASISFDHAQVERLDPAALALGWDDPVAPAELKKYGDDWVANQDLPVLGVPSAIIRGEWNYLINPAHPKFNALVKSAPEPFVFDHRLG
jgi:RES domain-containing protein